MSIPTNDERREVAARLLGSVPSAAFPHGEKSWGRLYRALFGFYMPIKRAPDTYRDVVRRLADLIDPEPERTCRNVGGADGTNGEHYDFACGACGYCCDLPDPDYCPNCGAKVVEG